MNLERYHLIKAHERIRDAADALHAATICLFVRRDQDASIIANGYHDDATALLESAVTELGGKIVWPDPEVTEVAKIICDTVTQFGPAARERVEQ